MFIKKNPQKYTVFKTEIKIIFEKKYHLKKNMVSYGPKAPCVQSYR